MLRLLRWAFSIAFVIVAVPCIGLVFIAVHDWRPISPLGKGIDNLSFEDQIQYLILRDQLEHNSRLDDMRRSGGEVTLSAYPLECEPMESADLVKAVSGLKIGKIKIRTACGQGHEEQLYSTDLMHGSVLAGTSCGALCGEFSNYVVLPVLGMPIVVVTGGGEN
jgi:hypothetical protein